MIYGVIIDPYPYAAADHIWMPDVNGVDGRDGHTYTVAEVRELQASPAFASVMATSRAAGAADRRVRAREPDGVLVTANAFNFLGVPPVVGRTIQPSDIRANGDAEPVVVLSHRLWLRLFDGNPGAVGKTLRLNGRPHTIVGVMPPRFGWCTSDGFWLPLAPIRTDVPWVNRDRPAGAGRHRGRRRRADARHQPAAGGGAARQLSEAGLHDAAAQLHGRHRRQRRDADQPAPAARRGRPSCC